MLIIIFLGTSCGILYGFGFRSVGSRIRSSMDVRDYMIVCCYGIILYFIAANSTVAAAGYPPFGISSIMIIPVASLFILVGLSNSAIAVAHDANLRHEIKNTISRARFLDKIGNAERFQDVEDEILKLAKLRADQFTTQSGIQPSISDDEMKQYLNDIIEDKRFVNRE